MLKIYVPPIARVCPIHANKYLWRSSDVENKSNDFTKENIEDMFELLTNRSTNEEIPMVLSKIFDFALFFYDPIKKNHRFSNAFIFQ